MGKGYNEPMSISLEEVKHVAKLARLDLDDVELMSFQSELNALLGHFQDISDLDVTGRDPKPHAVALTNVFGEDIPRAGLDRSEAMRSAAVTKAGLFIVPTIIQE